MNVYIMDIIGDSKPRPLLENFNKERAKRYLGVWCSVV